MWKSVFSGKSLRGGERGGYRRATLHSRGSSVSQTQFAAKVFVIHVPFTWRLSGYFYGHVFFLGFRFIIDWRVAEGWPVSVFGAAEELEDTPDNIEFAGRNLVYQMMEFYLFRFH